MRFFQWLNKYYPTFESRLVACQSYLQEAASVVDIDYLASSLAEGKNKRNAVKTLSKESAGRCQAYVNRNRFRDEDFPLVVFLNLRNSYKDSASGKAAPSVVNCATVLYKMFKEGVTEVVTSNKSNVLTEAKEQVSQEKLINEQRQWYSKLKDFNGNISSKYFSKKGVTKSEINEITPFIRYGFSTRYGAFAAIPLRNPLIDSFEGFQRIYDNGAKIMLRDYNPNGLCVYFSNYEDKEICEPDVVIFHEGVANALLSQKICNELGLNSVNIACLYESNIINVVSICFDDDSFKPKQAYLLHDNDLNGVGKNAADKCKESVPALNVVTTTRNDICATAQDLGVNYAKKELKQLLS